MTEEPKGLFTDVDWEKIDSQEDYESEIPALRGDYIGEAKDFKYVESELGGFYSLNVQINETVNATIKGENRYVSKTFNIGETQYQSEEEGKERIFKFLKTIGAKAPDEVVGKSICVKVRPNMDKDTKKVKTDKNGWPKHIVTVVEGFKGKSVLETPSDNVPF